MRPRASHKMLGLFIAVFVLTNPANAQRISRLPHSHVTRLANEYIGQADSGAQEIMYIEARLDNTYSLMGSITLHHEATW